MSTPNSPIFVLGSPRSGTSVMVDALLQAGYNGFREGHFLPLITSLGLLVDRHYSFLDASDDRILISNIQKRDIKSKIFNVLKSEVENQHHGTCWFDKTGDSDMILAVPILQILWPEGRFIFTKRRAMENMVSRLRKFPQHSFEYHCRDWAQNMLSWRQVREAIPADRFIEIDQQEIFRCPERAGRRLVALLGVAPEQAIKIIETFKNNRPQQSSEDSAGQVYSLKTVGWGEGQRHIFDRYCLKEMELYNYSVDESYTTDKNFGELK